MNGVSHEEELCLYARRLKPIYELLGDVPAPVLSANRVLELGIPTSELVDRRERVRREMAAECLVQVPNSVCSVESHPRPCTEGFGRFAARGQGSQVLMRELHLAVPRWQRGCLRQYNLDPSQHEMPLAAYDQRVVMARPAPPNISRPGLPTLRARDRARNRAK